MAQPAALVVPVSGPYVGTFDAFPIGTLNDDGYEFRCTLPGQEISETDAFGMTLVEGITRGQNWRVLIRGLEWKRGLLQALQQFGSAFPQPGADPGILSPILANIGDRWSKFGNSMVLIAILGNPPTIPQSVTALAANFAPNSQSSFLLTSKMREIPIEFILLPYVTTENGLSVIAPFTVT